MAEGLGLSEIEKAKIEREEMYRSEFKKNLELTPPKKSFANKILAFFNTSLGGWLLSAIFISGAGALYTQHQNTRSEKARIKDLTEKLDLEIGYRFSQVQIQLYSLVDAENSQFPLSRSKSEMDVKVALDTLLQPPKSAFNSFYQEFSNVSTIALIANLRRVVPAIEKAPLEQVLAHLSGLYIHLKIKNVQLGNVRGVANLVFKDLTLSRWRDSKFYFSDCPFC